MPTERNTKNLQRISVFWQRDTWKILSCVIDPINLTRCHSTYSSCHRLQWFEVFPMQIYFFHLWQHILFCKRDFYFKFQNINIERNFSRTSTIKFNTVGNKSKTHNSGKSYFYDTGNYNDHDCDSLIYDWPWPWRRPWLLILRYQRKFALLQGFLLRNMLTIASNGYGKDFDAHDNDFVVLILSSIVTTMN